MNSGQYLVEGDRGAELLIPAETDLDVPDVLIGQVNKQFVSDSLVVLWPSEPGVPGAARCADEVRKVVVLKCLSRPGRVADWRRGIGSAREFPQGPEPDGALQVKVELDLGKFSDLTLEIVHHE
jgi:hypothetical protein